MIELPSSCHIINNKKLEWETKLSVQTSFRATIFDMYAVVQDPQSSINTCLELDHVHHIYSFNQ
jgi:hypothetical protein